jgi:hypothetical protein
LRRTAQASVPVRRLPRSALVVGVVVAGTAALVAGFAVGDSAIQDVLFLAGPVALGAFVACVAGAQGPLLGLGAATFVVLGIAVVGLMGADARAEGGAIVAVWVVGVELVGMYGAAGVWLAVRRKPWRRWTPARRRWIVAIGAAVVVVGAIGAVAVGVSGRSDGFDSPSHRRATQREAAQLTSRAKHLRLRGRITFAVPSQVGASLRVLLMTMNADGSDLRRIATPPNIDVDGIAGTPDGSNIAFSSGRNIYEVDARRNGSKRIAVVAASSTPAWSPDGKRVAFSRASSCDEVNGQVVADCQRPTDGIYVARADGDRPRQIVSAYSDGDAPSWSPDGKRMVFSWMVHGWQSLWAVQSDGRGLEQLTPGPEHQPTWSPDGRLIASNCGPVDGGSLCVTGADDSRRRKLVSLAVTSLAWSPDGRWIVFLAAGNADAARDGLWVIRPDGSQLTKIFPPFLYRPGVGWIDLDVVFTQPLWTR